MRVAFRANRTLGVTNYAPKVPNNPWVLATTRAANRSKTVRCADGNSVLHRPRRLVATGGVVGVVRLVARQ